RSWAGVCTAGLWLAGPQRYASDYFLGHRGLPWLALMLSIVATETSAVTVISVPGLAARGNLTFLQIAVGYLVGRIGVAALLLPGYFEGTQDTAYQRLERRFGRAARRTASGVFLLTRALADCVRIFATAIPLAIITHWSLPAGILAIGAVTLAYTWVGGLRAVVWVDVIQLGVYLLGGVATLVVATRLAGGVGAFARAWEHGRGRDLSVVRDHAAAGGRRGPRGGRHPRRGDEQPCLGRQLARLRVHARLLRAAHAPRGSGAFAAGRPLAHAGLDGRARGRRDDVPQPEHPRRAAGAQRRVHHLRQFARHLPAGRPLGARRSARRDRAH